MTYKDAADVNKLKVLLRRIIAECRHPARLIELYYWSAEPELAEVMRYYIALRPEVRFALHAFLTLAAEQPGSISVKAVREGEMTLASPAADELPAAVAQRGPPGAGVH